MDTLSNKMSSQVETLLIVGNEDTDVSLDLITKSAQIPERYYLINRERDSSKFIKFEVVLFTL